MNYKNFYPITGHQTYLNTAASGLLSEPLLEFKQKNLRSFFERGSGYLANEEEIINNTKEKISKIYNVGKKRVAITPNYSLSYNAVLDGLPADFKILCLDEDYLSVIMPIKLKGFNFKSIPITPDIESDIINNIKTYKPHALALSIVQYLSGIKLKKDFFKDLKAEFPDLIILVDATQYLGTEQFDFDISGIDYLSASCYKWINAGYGNAISMFSEALLNQLTLKQVGSNSYADKTKMSLKPMGNLEPGHYDLNAVAALGKALDFHYKTIGITKIEQQIQLLSEKAFNELKRLNLLEDNIVSRTSHSSIFMLKIDQSKFEAFEKAKIILSKRGNGLRISFNYFNTFDDLEYLINFLKP